jgi:hypothetical protein
MLAYIFEKERERDRNIVIKINFFFKFFLHEYIRSNINL